MSLSRRHLLCGCTALAGTGFLGGCAENPATGRAAFTPFMSPEAEARIAAQEHPKLVASFGGEYDNPRVASYVQSIGMEVARTSEMPDLDYRFTLLNTPIVNAFALPAGYIYITRGLLALAQNEAELAGVLAHEVGHVTGRHTAERYSRAMAANIGLMILGVAGAGAAPGLMDVAQLGAGVYIQGFSREQEFEADLLGVRYMTRAGYDPEAMATFLAILREQSRLEARIAGRPEDSVDQFNIMATHPRTIDRVQRAMQEAGAVRPPDARTARARYLEAINGMMFGDDPEQGLILGHRFVHPVLRFEYQVPAGFRLINGEDQVVATDNQGAAIVFDMARIRRAPTMAAYLTQEWAANTRLSGVESITVNGLEAATGVTRLQGRQGPVDARPVAIRRSTDEVYRLLFITPVDRTAALEEDLRRTTYSFRELTAEEAAGIRPMRLLVVPVTPGDSIESLARGLPFGRYNEDWFRLLNAIEPNRAPRPGEQVKVVAH